MTMIKIEFLLLSSIVKTCLDEAYPEVFVALRIITNSPDTFASAERSSSKLKMIKTFNRSHMTNSRLSSFAMLSIEASSVRSPDLDAGPRHGVGGDNAPGRHFWWKQGIANGLSRMNLKLDVGLGFRFWLRLDLPYVPVWPGLSRFKHLSRHPVPVHKMSQNFTFIEIF